MREHLPSAYKFDFYVVERVLEQLADRFASSNQGATEMVELRVTKLRIGPDARWFALDQNERVSLDGSPTGRRLLQRLLKAHHETPGQGIGFEVLREAAWPGDKCKPDSAANRLYVALTRLRDRGLRGIVVRREDGWLLAPEVEVA